MFYGEYEHTLDDKGRMIIPARFREKLAGGLVITRGLDECLMAFPRVEWEALAEKIKALPLTQPEARDFRRHMFSGASDEVPDRQGRVLLPPRLREYAHLDSEVVIIGLYDRIEIWNPEKWAGVVERVESDPEALARKFAELGI